MDLISVVVPVYNVELYLKECIDSILKQTYKNFELLLIDDGSTDSSGKICDEIKNCDSRIRVFHNSNIGLSDTRNFGITESKGKYISFIDSDDVIAEDYLEKLYTYLVKNNVKISCCGIKPFYSEIEPDTENKEFLFNKVDSLKYLNIMGFYGDSSCNKLFDISLFDELKFPSGLAYEDRRIMYKIFDSANGVSYFTNSKYFYRQRSGSVTHTFDKLYQVIETTLEEKEYIDKKYPELSKYTGQNLVVSYMVVFNKLFIGNKKLESKRIYSEVKTKKIKFSYESLPFIKRIQLFLFLNNIYLYKLLIRLLKKKL